MCRMALKPGERQNHAPVVRRGAAGQARAGAARDDGHAQPMTQFERGGDLRFGVGKHHRQRRGAVGGERIAFVGHGVFQAEQHRAARQNLLQRGHDVPLAFGTLRIDRRTGLSEVFIH